MEQRHPPGRGAEPVVLQVTTRQRPDFQQPLMAWLFDGGGRLAARVEVKDGRLELPATDGGGHGRLFITPVDERLVETEPTTAMLERLGAYEPVLLIGERLKPVIDIPGLVIDHWPFCFCWLRGRVERLSDHRAICGARVHVCEVDRLPWWIRRLPERDIFKLRDDLLEVLRRPPVPQPVPGPEPFDPRPLFRSGMPQALNPQPLPPQDSIELPAALQASLRSRSAQMVRSTLADHAQLLLPWLCLWPHWWWRLRCDEMAVLTTDNQGRFETTLFYPCHGDHPDLYFWVEYDFGSGFETVYRPGMACNTHWNYACGTPVTLRVPDPRVPGCEEEPDLPGRQVVVLSIGRGVAVRELQATGAGEGLTTAGEPFGGTLEPRVDFSRSALIGGGIPYYRWSYRRLSGPDGVAATVDAASVPLGVWSVMSRDVYRHYKLDTSFPSERMGPMPTAGADAAPLPNLFRIRPVAPPAGTEWVVLDENVDLATAYLDSHMLAGAPTAAPWPDDLAAGRYELKLELFDSAGALVDWTAQGIDLRITDQDAPFGTGTVTSSTAPAHNRVLVGGATMGFRMVLRVDNNRCSADIQPVGGTVSPDPVCGFHNYAQPSDTAGLSFEARHPNGFATYGFSVTRGPGPALAVAGTSGVAGAPGSNGYLQTGSFSYGKAVTVSALLGPCSNAAYAERLEVSAMATNGYGTLTQYNAADNAAFALAMPCPACECTEAEGGTA
ncbi:hypothetical protein [Aquincola tertiaricarbonis]|uniref:hypothetical protein n=1 Tax=Aquincola tertiaricarbonis TaxID=391953 RepID=UPI000614F3F2|nr:hypothetical protein [Aquincola tertiaricarbonis]